jgi:hypothetical protein
MLRTATRIAVIAIAALICVFAVLLWAAESRVVGTWEYTTLDAIGRMRFYPDHKTAWWFVDSSSESIEPHDAVYGTWHIRGVYLVCAMDYTPVFKDSDMRPPPSHGKLPLGDFLFPRPNTGDRPYMVRIHK